MKRILARAAAVLLVVGGAVAVMWPVDQWRLYDANWRPLALTEAESYCSGYHGMEAGFSESHKLKHDIHLCVVNSPRGHEPSIANAVRWACIGVEDASGFPRFDCEGQVEAYQLWFLLEGGLAGARDWSDSNPRPVAVLGGTQVAPRGERQDDIERPDIGGRLGS